MTKSKSIFILCLAILIVIFSGCSKQENISMSELQTSTTVVDADETTTEEKTESETATEIKSNSESTAVKSETTTNKSSSGTTAKNAEQKSAGQTTTKKQSETSAQRVNSQTTATNHETTKVAATTKKETTTKKQTTTEKPFDVSYWVSYAEDYARSVGLEVNSSASDCWDNPISANSKCKYLERDIKGMLNRYAKDEDITQIWVWAEKTSADSYNIYIGYA